MTANALGLLGLARKARMLELGEEPVGAACRDRQAKLVALACDAADNTLRRARRLAEAAKVPCIETPWSKEELGRGLGRATCAVLAITDSGLAAAFLEKLAANDPRRYGEAAQRQAANAAEVLRRKRKRTAKK